jgi:hypothetical protein
MARMSAQSLGCMLQYGGVFCVDNVGMVVTWVGKGADGESELSGMGCRWSWSFESRWVRTTKFWYDWDNKLLKFQKPLLSLGTIKWSTCIYWRMYYVSINYHFFSWPTKCLLINSPCILDSIPLSWCKF